MRPIKFVCLDKKPEPLRVKVELQERQDCVDVLVNNIKVFTFVGSSSIGEPKHINIHKCIELIDAGILKGDRGTHPHPFIRYM